MLKNNRIIVVGTSGSGKTTLASMLAAKLAVPHFELDAFYWQEGWVERPRSDFISLVTNATKQQNWVMDGNYQIAQNIIFAKATAVVWLNYSFPLVFFRVFKRTFVRVITRKKLYSDNVESIRKAFFSRDSILLWCITSFTGRRLRYRGLFNEHCYDNLEYIELTKPTQVRTLPELLQAKK